MTPDERFAALDDQVTELARDLCECTEAAAVLVLVLDPPWFGLVSGKPGLIADFSGHGASPERVASVLRQMADELEDNAERIVEGAGEVVRGSPSPVDKGGN